MEPPWQRRLAVRVTKDAERHIRSGHPWIYDGSIESAKPGEPGDLAVVFDHDRKFMAVGLYDPTSPLRIRILHAGSPETIDDEWLASAVARSVERREPLIERGDTNAMRLVHGENDGLGGLVIDRYDTNLVIKLYTVAWLPWLNHLVDAAVAAVAKVSATAVERVILRLSRHVASDSGRRDGEILTGDDLNGPVTFTENGLRFQADLVHGHKTGHFLDQRDNRRMIGSVADGREVLDVFACTGGFSVHAAVGGAQSVTSVDSSRPALDVAERNMALNADAAGVDHRTCVGDAFAVMEKLGGEGRTFDLVVVDPPSFAQRQAQVDRAISAYERLARLAGSLTRPGGLLFQASCSSRITEPDLVEAVNQGLAGSGRSWVERRRTGQPVDHPIGFEQGAYLKAVLLEAT